jgi:hypothetical protein
MLVYAFRAGKKTGVRTDNADAAAIVKYCAQFADRWIEQHEWFFEDMPIGATAFVETQLIIPPHNPQGRSPKIAHALAHREKQEPDTLFLGVLSEEEYDKQRSAASASWVERQATIRQRVEEMKPLAAGIVRWEDLSAELQARCHGANLSSDQCWIWRPMEHLRQKEDDAREEDPARYREFYIRIKGPIPDGVVLRHKCDNRQCMNPNHLEPGTLKDNTQYVMARGRHWRQQQIEASLTKRAEYDRNATLNAAWTEELLQMATALSQNRYSSSMIARELGNDISSKSVAGRLHYQKQARAKLARRQAYVRRKERKKQMADDLGPKFGPKRDGTGLNQPGVAP